MRGEENKLKGVDEQDLARAIDAQIEVSEIPSLETVTPQKLYVLPLQKAIPFPGIMMPVQLASERARESVQKAEKESGYIALVAQKHGKGSKKENDPQELLTSVQDNAPLDPKKLYKIGVVAKILKLLNLPDGGQAAMLHGVKRFRMGRVHKRKPLLVIRAHAHSDIVKGSKRVEAQIRNLQNVLKGIVETSPHIGDEFVTAALNIDNDGAFADFCAAYLIRDLTVRQEILETRKIAARLDIVVEVLTRELEILQLGAKIQEEIKSKIEKAQKEYFLREQIKIIRRELGEEVDARQAEIEKISEWLDAAGLPEGIESKAREELDRLKVTPVESPEYTVLRNHLDCIQSLPWNTSSDDRRNIRAAGKVLEEDHYALLEVKERILEFLAVRKLKGGKGKDGPILCLSGPPGVGKTSLGRSIARAMGRKFWRFSLGGMRDEAEIKGHRRTYVGAMPGRILQGLKYCGTNNPVVMLDEVDKLGSDFRGDPSSALLEVLDPEQNHAFLDHYLDLPFDLSKVFFVTTANVLTMIPPALRDRMEIIDIPGYLTSEKVEIARRHLIPKQYVAHGIGRNQLRLSKRVITTIVQNYTREAGVRNLEKAIAKICRKTALQVARGRSAKSQTIRPETLTKFLGQPRYGKEGERRLKGPGVAQGLAWTAAGGEVLFIEVVSWPGKGRIHVTGQLGEVMQESVRIANDYLRSRAKLFGLDLEKIGKSDMHVHFPAGAVPKDGPSAGITVACALLSTWLHKRFPKDLAITGELTLVGEVLPIGGVREKVLAARRVGLKRVLLPAENKPDVKEIDKDLVKGMKFLYVDTFEEVWRHLGF